MYDSLYTFSLLLHCSIQLDAIFCFHLVFPTDKSVHMLYKIYIMLKLSPNIPIAPEQIHAFKASVTAELTIYNFV